MPTIGRFAMLLPFLLVLIGPGSAAEPERQIGQVDLDKTLGLFQSWSQRDSFPDSVNFAYYNAWALETLQGEISEDTRSRLVGFVERCQDPGGGFVSNPRFPGAPNVIYTYYALKALQQLDALRRIDKSKATAFIRSLLRDDGSIAPSAKELDRATLASTFYGLASLEILGRLALADRDKVVDFVMRHRTSDDGFGVRPGGAGSAQAVAMAVQSLALVGGLTEEVNSETQLYLEGAMGLLGLKGKRHRAHSTMQAAADIVTALEAMQALGQVETSPLLTFVESLYIPQNGGFGPSPGYGTTPPSTYQGVYCLERLGKIPAPTLRAGEAAAGGVRPPADYLSPYRLSLR
jgi:prenyltransferase beta subunit